MKTDKTSGKKLVLKVRTLEKKDAPCQGKIVRNGAIGAVMDI